MKALRVSRLRVPEGAPEAHGFLADTALGRIIDVMMEQVTGPDAGNVLKAATRIREEVCGPLAQKHEVAGEGGGPLVVEIREYRDGEDA